MATAQAIQAPPMGPVIKANDRLGLTVFFAVVIHSLIILGISFSQPDKKDPPEKLPGLEITLVQTQTDEDIEDADFLAQANQEGGGSSESLQKPTSDVAPVIPTGETGDVSEFVAELVLPEASDPERVQILTSMNAYDKIDSQNNKEDIKSQQTDQTYAQLMSFSKEVEKRSAEVAQMRKAYARLPNTLYPDSARTKAYKPASYEEAFRKKVEIIGTLNFPNEAKRNKLSGNVRVSVTILADGNVKSINITKYSKHKILDDAAATIVRMAAPFEPLPDELRETYDEWVIVRTFQFLVGNKFGTKR